MNFYLLKYYCSLFLVFCTSVTLSSQFEGGFSDGHYKTGVLQNTLNGDQLNTVALYAGGFGDGHHKNSFAGVMNGVSLTSIYAGGSGDGHHKEMLSTVMDGTTLAMLYRGGNGDGHHKNLVNAVMDGTALNLWTGGNGDGHDKMIFQGTMDGTFLSTLYMGGAGDGAHKTLVGALLNGESLAQLYRGGMGDGHDKFVFNGVVDGTSLAGVYSGGDGDGFSKKSIEYIFTFPGCTFVVNTDDDGFGSLRYAVDCAMPGDTISFSPLIYHQTIGLSSGEIPISKDLNILHNPLVDLFVDGSTIERAFSIGFGQKVTISGLKIIAGNGLDANGIFNQGMTTLIDLTVTNSVNGAPAILSTGSSTITVIGTVKIKQ